MNQTIIQERSGLNQFYAKVYAFVGLGIGLSALVSALMLTVFPSSIDLLFNAWPSLVDDCNFCRTWFSLCCK